MKKLLVFAACATLCLPLASAQQPVTWRFDSLTQVAGLPATVVGSPKLIDTGIGKAIHFEGHGDTGDAIFLDNLPLAGTLTYTFELIFRPSSAGHPEQRIFHLQEAGSQSRRMFEIRIHDDKWCLDTVAINDPPERAHSGVIMNCDPQHLFPVDRWYAVAAVYDGKILRGFVDGVLQGEIAVTLQPLSKGGTSVGTRFNKRDFFTGDMFSARFTPKTLTPDQFLRVPAKP